MPTAEPTNEQTADAAAQEARAFDQAFHEGATTPTGAASPPPAAVAPPETAPVPSPSATAATPTEGEPAAEYVQITQAEAESFRQTAAALKALQAELDKKFGNVEKQFGTAFGNLGGLKRVMDQMQAATPTGQPVTVSEEDFAELKEEFPDLAAMSVKGLNRVLGKLKGTGAAIVTPPSLPPEVAAQIAEAAAEQADQKTSIRMLSWFQPGWREIVGSPGETNAYRTWLSTLAPERQRELNDTWDAGVIADSIGEFVSSQQDALEELRPDWQGIVGAEGDETPFRQWLKGQPASYQTHVQQSWDPSVVADAIARFHTQTKTAPSTPASPSPAAPHPQRARLAAAVQPRGAGAPASRSGEKTEEEAFEEAIQ